MTVWITLCGYCTNEEAHKPTRKHIIGCNDVHQNVSNDNDVSEITREMSNDKHAEDKHCICGNHTEGLFECIICRQHFCEECPSGPLKLEKQSKCLDCLFLDNQLQTSTPEKKQPKETTTKYTWCKGKCDICNKYVIWPSTSLKTWYGPSWRTA